MVVILNTLFIPIVLYTKKLKTLQFNTPIYDNIYILEFWNCNQQQLRISERSFFLYSHSYSIDQILYPLLVVNHNNILYILSMFFFTLPWSSATIYGVLV